MILICRADLYTLMDFEVAKCYLENIPQDTLVVSTFHANPNGNTNEEQSKFSMNIIVSQNEGEKIIATKDYPLNGKHAFTTPEGGEYKICFKIIGKEGRGWFANKPQWKFYADITTGSKAQDYSQIARVEHLTDLEKQMRYAVDRAIEIRSEQKYLRNREAIFRGYSENIYSRVMWWSMAQIFILLISAFIQVRYLKNFFTKKKVV